jgi:site-specific recombinase XerD
VTRRRVPRGPLTLQQAFEAFAADLAARRRTPLTLEWYQKNLCRRFRVFMSARGIPDDVRQVRRDHLRDFARYINDECWAQDRDGLRTPRRLSAHTAVGAVKAVRAFFAWLHAERLIETDAVENLTAPQVRQDPKPAYTDDEIARLLAAPKKPTPVALRTRAFIGFIAETACRVSEARTVQVPDLDLATRRVRVTGKGSRTRTLPVSDGLAALLTEYLERARPHLATTPSPWLFLSEDGNALTLSAAEQLFRRACAVASIPHKGRGMHGLRRSFTVRWIKRGGDAYTLRLLLGHHGMNVIAHHYASLLPQDVDDRFRSLGVSVLPGGPPEVDAPKARAGRPRRRARRRRFVRR